MSGLERAVEQLRPLVEARAWDYAVVWKLSEDPSSSRIFELLNCCCSGGYQCPNVKEEKGEICATSLCIDSYFQHPIRTKACEALFQLPSSLPQLSAIYEEVMISNQPKWFTYTHCSDLTPSPEFTGTKVLIPIYGGIIELFVTKQVPEDRKAVDYVIALCNTSFDQAFMSAINYDNVSISQQLLYSTPVNYSQSRFQPNSYPNFERSSSSSSHDPPFDFYAYFTSQNGQSRHPMSNFSDSKRVKYNQYLQNQQEYVGLNEENIVKKVNTKSHYHARNIDRERNRRKRLNEGLLALRSLVPKISKMDRASIIGDAIDFIEELQMKVKDLQYEIKEMEEDNATSNRAELKISSSGSKFKEIKDMKVEIEVSKLGKRNLLIKLLNEKKMGGFGRLVEAVECLGLQVVNANITTFHNKVLNILIVEAKKGDIQVKQLKDSLIKVAGYEGQ